MTETTINNKSLEEILYTSAFDLADCLETDLAVFVIENLAANIVLLTHLYLIELLEVYRKEVANGANTGY